MYLLNLVPSKLVPKTPHELWTGRKPSLRHIHIWGCPAHVLKGKTDKMESRSEVCLFVGYPKGTRGSLFYSTHDKKVFVSTHATFLEEDYIKNYKPKSKVILEELKSENTQVSVSTEEQEQLHENEEINDPVAQQSIEFRRSGRTIRTPVRYMFLGETFQAISIEPEQDPTSYKEAI
ncbi:hypothetical protein UlMin_032296 [Ulmus minor]